MNKKSNEVVIVAAARTPIGTYKGSLKYIKADQLGSVVIKEVIKRANDNDLGLASYVYTNSLEKAHKVSEQMETGTCAVNTPAVAFAEVPFGGMKQTGYGREGGSMAIKDYLNIKYTHFGINY